jgi:hypothetical protein
MANIRDMSGVKPGARVVTADAKQIGRVKVVREDEFLVEVRFAADYWLGIETVDEAAEDEVQLLITKSAVGSAKLPNIKSIDDSSMPSRQ